MQMTGRVHLVLMHFSVGMIESLNLLFNLNILCFIVATQDFGNPEKTNKSHRRGLIYKISLTQKALSLGHGTHFFIRRRK